jgi:hypothetical protein
MSPTVDNPDETPGSVGATRPLPQPEGASASSDASAGELEELRRENEELRKERTHERRRAIWNGVRSTIVVVLLVVGTLLAFVTPVAIWGRNQLLNTDRYVATMAPLASNPEVQNGVIKIVTEQVQPYVDVSSVLKENLPPRLATTITGPLNSALQNVVNTIVTKFVQSDVFPTLWVQMNRAAHTAIVGLLTGKTTNGGITTTNGVINLNLAPVIQQVKAKLVAAGISVASKIPAVNATFQIAKVKGLEHTQDLVRKFNDIALALPWIVLALFAGAIALARRHLRCLVASALCIAGAMLVLRLLLAAAKSYYMNKRPGTYLSDAGAAYVFDTVTRFLVDGMRIVFVVALIIALVAAFFGSSRPAVSLRRGVAKGWTGSRDWISGRMPESAFGRFLADWRTPLTWGVLGVAAVLLIAFADVGWGAFLTIVILAVLCVLFVQAAGRRGKSTAVAADGGNDDATLHEGQPPAAPAS